MDKVVQSVSLVVTSCSRPDLLKRTLDSFYKYNTYPISKVIIIEDGIGTTPDIQNIVYLNSEHRGQVPSIDLAYSYVDTPYIFHCEDDWEFYDYGFIEASLDILEKHNNILQVWLREHNDTNTHPIVKLHEFEFETMRAGMNMWHGFSWNPGLRRLSDYKRIGSYSEYSGHDNASTESNIGCLYKDLGYHAAILPKGYVRHIGWGRSVTKWN